MCYALVYTMKRPWRLVCLWKPWVGKLTSFMWLKDRKAKLPLTITFWRYLQSWTPLYILMEQDILPFRKWEILPTFLIEGFARMTSCSECSLHKKRQMNRANISNIIFHWQFQIKLLHHERSWYLSPWHLIWFVFGSHPQLAV